MHYHVSFLPLYPLTSFRILIFNSVLFLNSIFLSFFLHVRLCLLTWVLTYLVRYSYNDYLSITNTLSTSALCIQNKNKPITLHSLGSASCQFGTMSCHLTHYFIPGYSWNNSFKVAFTNSLTSHHQTSPQKNCVLLPYLGTCGSRPAQLLPQPGLHLEVHVVVWRFNHVF